MRISKFIILVSVHGTFKNFVGQAVSARVREGCGVGETSADFYFAFLSLHN